KRPRTVRGGQHELAPYAAPPHRSERQRMSPWALGLAVSRRRSWPAQRRKDRRQDMLQLAAHEKPPHEPRRPVAPLVSEVLTARLDLEQVKSVARRADRHAQRHTSPATRGRRGWAEAAQVGKSTTCRADPGRSCLEAYWRARRYDAGVLIDAVRASRKRAAGHDRKQGTGWHDFHD